MRKIICLMAAVLLITPLTACHKHIPGQEATCLEAQICTKCGEIIVEPLGHEAGSKATCTEPQRCLRCDEILEEALGHKSNGESSCTKNEECTVCGEVLTLAAGHEIASNGACSVCGEQIIPEGQEYISPGAHVQTSADVIPETQNTGHYTNDIPSFYANAVLVCGDYGIEYFSPDPTGSSSYAATINAFADKYPQLNITSLLVPKCAAFESPADRDNPYEATKNFISSTYDMMDSRVKKADCMGIMTQHDGEYMFYRTDHHWTSLGAYYASQAYCDVNGITCRALEDYETVINPGYAGSLYMYGGYPSQLKQNPDYTVGHMPATGYSMVYYRDGYRYSGTAINENSSSYAGMFICGDQPLTVITTANKNGKTLIIFKESYGNAFVPFMIDYYEQVIVVDIRETTDSVAQIIDQYHVTDALIINNVQGALSLRSNLETKIMS